MSKVSDKKAKLLESMKAINKKMGAGVIKFGIDEAPKTSFEWPVPELNQFCKALVKGNFSVLWGGNSVGKSTLAYQTIAHNQKAGFTCCLIDAEHNFNVERAKEFDINLDELVLIEEIDTAEDGMDIIIQLCKDKVVDLFVVDSVQAMSPEGEQQTKKEVVKSISDDEMAMLARKLSKFFRVCATPLYKANAHLLLIGQVRKGLGSFIVQDSLSGGEAQNHWATAIMQMRRGQKADAPSKKEKIVHPDSKKETVTVPLGHDCVFKINKTKVTGSKPEGSDIHIPFYFSSGFIAPLEEVLPQGGSGRSNLPEESELEPNDESPEDESHISNKGKKSKKSA